VTTLEVGLIVAIVSLLGGFFIHKAFYNKKDESVNIDEKKVMMCPLERKGTIQSIIDIENKVDKIQSDLKIGVDVATRNTQHYEKFNDLLLTMNQSWKMMVDTLKEIKEINTKQNESLIKIAKNGH